MEYRLADRMNNISGSVIREIFKMLADPAIISFAGGAPASEALPRDLIARHTAQLLADDGPKMLQYGITEGYMPLRESVSGWVSHLGIRAAADNTLIVTGGQQGVDLVLKVLLNPGDKVLVEAPTFLATLNAIRIYQGVPVGIPMDDEGVELEALETAMQVEEPKLLYLIPTFQNPTGRTMSLARRKAVLALAAKYNVLILEDDPYRDLRFAGKHLPTIKSMDDQGVVAYLGSFSKLVSPGLRVGYLIPPKTLQQPIVVAKQVEDVHTPTLIQAVVDKMLRNNELMPHVESVKPLYIRKLDAMAQALAALPVAFTKPEGGLFIWLKLRQPNAQAVFQQALQRKVACIPGAPFFAQEADGAYYLRCNFTASTIEQITEGAQRLGEALEAAI